jgi:Prenyltransferase and squalene oxidase repeat
MLTILSRKPISHLTWAPGRQVSCKIGVSRGGRAPLKACSASRLAAIRRLRWPPVVLFLVPRQAARWWRHLANPSVLARAARCIPTPSRSSRLFWPRLIIGLVLFSASGQRSFAQTPQRIDRSIETEAQKLVTPETQAAIDRGLAYLAARQSSRDGSLGSSASARRRVAITALSGMAFLSSGSTPGRGKYGTNVQKAIDFLLTRCQPNGFIYDEGNTGGHFGPMYDHGFATLFLGEVYGMTRNPQVRTNLERAVRLIVNSQNKEGGWRYEPDSKDADLSVTVCEMMALRAARNSGIYVPKQTIDRCTEYVRKCQTQDGGFRYQLTTSWQAVTFGLTAAGVVTLYSAGIYEGKSLELGLSYLERYRPSSTLHQPANHYFYSHYYAAQAMWHAGGQRFEQWYSDIRDELIHGPFPFRNSGGGWRDPSSYGDEYGTAMALLILQTPNNYLPIFQR